MFNIEIVTRFWIHVDDVTCCTRNKHAPVQSNFVQLLITANIVHVVLFSDNTGEVFVYVHSSLTRSAVIMWHYSGAVQFLDVSQVFVLVAARPGRLTTRYKTFGNRQVEGNRFSISTVFLHHVEECHPVHACIYNSFYKGQYCKRRPGNT